MKVLTVLAGTLVGVMTLRAQGPVQSLPIQSGGGHAVLNPPSGADKDRDQLDRSLAVQSISQVAQPTPGVLRADVQLTNLSGKTITAHWGSVNVRYADGKEVTQIWNEDLLMDTILTRIPGVTVQGPKTLRNGETRTIVLTLAPGADGSAPVFVSAHSTTLIFEDRTALGDGGQIGTTLEFRRVYAEDMYDVVERLRSVRAHPGVLAAISTNADPMPAVRAALSEQIRKPSRVSADRDAFRLTQLRALEKTLLNPVSLNVLDGMIQREQALQSAAAEQSILREVK
jgi:hypothetical protein